MAWVSGTCVGHVALLDALKTFLTSNTTLVEAEQNWLVLADVSTDTREVYFKGVGFSGTDEIFIGFKVFDDSTADTHNVAVAGFTGYREGIPFFSQPGAGSLYMTLTDQSITYWFIADGRRVIIIARVGGVYMTAYLGFFLPYTNPSAYPYPLCVGANALSATQRFSEQNTNNFNFFNPLNADKSTLKYMYGGLWRDVYYSAPVSTIGTKSGYLLHQVMTNGLPLTLNPDGVSRYMTPLDIVCDLGFIGRLDGIMVTTGYGAVAEDTLTPPDGSTWLMIPNVYRSDVSRFAAILLA